MGINKEKLIRKYTAMGKKLPVEEVKQYKESSDGSAHDNSLDSSMNEVENGFENQIGNTSNLNDSMVQMKSKNPLKF